MGEAKRPDQHAAANAALTRLARAGEVGGRACQRRGRRWPGRGEAWGHGAPTGRRRRRGEACRSAGEQGATAACSGIDGVMQSRGRARLCEDEARHGAGRWLRAPAEAASGAGPL